MSDDDGPPKRAGIPSWQQASSASLGEQQQKPKDTANESPAETEVKPNSLLPRTDAEDEQPPNEERIEQGRRFLLDESVRNAPLEQRKSFLEAKGLSEVEIEKAVELSRQAKGDNTREPSPPGPQFQSYTAQFHEREQHSSIPERPQPPTEAPPSASQTQRSTDAPPIITYPEHLLRAQKPPPLVTWSRLLNTAYAASAVTAALYGCSKYLINPMMETLTEARHDFATHSQEQLKLINRKLSSVISVDPNARGGWKQEQEAAGGERYKDTAGEDEDEDPTELFHRDFGTQTSPDLLKDTSGSDTSSSDGEDSKSKNDPNMQALKLQNLAAYCTSISSGDLIDSTEDQSTLTVMRVLKDYLESLAYPGYSSTGVCGGGSSNSSTTGGKKEETESDRFKSEIRGIKGTLLSARNFPSGRGRGALGGRGQAGVSRGGAGGPRSTMFPSAGETDKAETAA